ncbi:MAG: class I SAM-dependent methyltransferase [Syntrophales bacterium]
MTDNARIGPSGDFYTSPHVHPIFGWLLGNQLDEIKRKMGDPDDFTILEIGAGRGYLAEGILDFVQRNLKWKGRWRYIIIERNPNTVQDQKKLLDAYRGLVTWEESLAEVGQFCGCIITNELLDAFPVHLVLMKDVIQEVYVEEDEKGFIEIYKDLSCSELSEYIKQYRVPEKRGYRTEINMRIQDYLKDIDDIMSEGFLISIDYGYSAREYYTEERHKGTLLCYYTNCLTLNVTQGGE